MHEEQKKSNALKDEEIQREAELLERAAKQKAENEKQIEQQAVKELQAKEEREFVGDIKKRNTYERVRSFFGQRNESNAPKQQKVTTEEVTGDAFRLARKVSTGVLGLGGKVVDRTIKDYKYLANIPKTPKKTTSKTKLNRPAFAFNTDFGTLRKEAPKSPVKNNLGFNFGNQGVSLKKSNFEFAAYSKAIKPNIAFKTFDNPFMKKRREL